MAWHGVAWHGMAWRGVAWRRGPVLTDMVPHGPRRRTGACLRVLLPPSPPPRFASSKEQHDVAASASPPDVGNIRRRSGGRRASLHGELLRVRGNEPADAPHEFRNAPSNGALCDTARLQRTMGIAEVARDDADINSAG